MCLVEQTFNVRPSIPASDDPEDLEALPTNHFIMGRANVCIPFLPTYANHRKMFRSSQANADMIVLEAMGERIPPPTQCKSPMEQIGNKSSSWNYTPEKMVL